MVQTKISHLGNVSYAIILLGWWYLRSIIKQTQKRIYIIVINPTNLFQMCEKHIMTFQ